MATTRVSARRRWAAVLAGAAMALAGLGGCSSDSEAANGPAPAPGALPEDVFTPLVARVATPSVQPVVGTDGKAHLVYELVVTNTRSQPATLQGIAVLDALDPSRVVATFDAAAVAERIRSLDNQAGNATLPLGATQNVLIDLTMEPAAVPSAIVHRLDLQAASIDSTAPAPVAQRYVVARKTIDPGAPIVVGPPLAGGGWVAFNGCCGPDGVHRATGLPVNGDIHFAQRFAIDYIRMDAQGFTVRGDPTDVRSYVAYGADVLAVADGTVVGVLDELDDQVPPRLPPPSTINLRNVDGNHVILDLGGGRYAFYAHLQRGSVRVALGDRVARGQVLGRLGNSGNTSAPHLHFHVMDSPSVLGSSGLPFVIDDFAYAGLVPDALAADDRVSWASARFASPTRGSRVLPMNQAIVDFR